MRIAIWILAATTGVTPVAGQGSAAPAADWQAEVRAAVAGRQLDRAAALVNARLATAPTDGEALGWRGRLLAWSGRWAEAERDYRTVLNTAPNDSDMLLGLADVLAWQQRFEEALATLEPIRGPEREAALRAEVELRRGRALRALRRSREARVAFHAALAADPQKAEARAGLASVAAEPRHELRAGADFDTFNYTEGEQAYSVHLRSQWNDRWATGLGLGAQNRFGEQPVRATAGATYRLTTRDSVTAGFTAGDGQGVVADREVFAEYGRGWRLSPRGFLRGIEAGERAHALWFSPGGGRVLALTSSALLYLPRDWTWSVQVTAARTRFTGTPAGWQPSAMTRLSFPLRRSLTGNAFFAAGTENFARADQLGRFSARTWGGGARWAFAARQEVSGYAAYQDRSQGRTQSSFGWSYAIRF
jgi:tetratricopeptide (TPR) repeat protein